MKQIIISATLSLVLIITSIVNLVIQIHYREAIKKLQENLACARLNKDFVSTEDGFCFGNTGSDNVFFGEVRGTGPLKNVTSSKK